MRTYAMHIRDTLELPLRTFWMMHRNIDRMAAEQDRRNISVFGHSFSGGEGLERLVEHLDREIGSVVETDDRKPDGQERHPVLDMEFDAEGLNALKGLGGL